MVYAWPAFSVYPHLAAASGARAIEVPLDDEDRHDLDAMAAEITAATRLVLICNPNNPTSTSLPLDAVSEFLERVPRHVCVILDEAYCEFALALGDTYASLELLRRWPNLVLLRTFSKVYGLAGLRVGYGLCGSEEFRAAVDQVRQPFYLNMAAAGGGGGGPAPPGRGRTARRAHRGRPPGADLRPARARPVGGGVRRQLRLDPPARGRGRGRHSQRPQPSAACWCGPGTALGREGSLRVTVGTDAENRRFLQAISELV